MSKRFLELKWTLVLSVLILIPTLVQAQAQYVGADKCAACHRGHYDDWKATGSSL